MNLRIGININWFARLHGTAFQNIVPIFVSRFPQASDVGCWDRARARRCTGGGLPSSPFRYARWVHSSTLATFPEAPDNPGRPNFTRRSEEHTSELQSRGHLVCRLLLEKRIWRRAKPGVTPKDL